MNEVQNPNSPAPVEISDNLVSLEVTYKNFDHKQRTGTIILNKLISKEVSEFFEQALKIDFPIYSVIPIHEEQFKWNDEKSCIANNSSAFNYREISNSNNLSKHSIGCAFDINPVQNIYVKYDPKLNEIYRLPSNGVYNESTEGTLTTKHPLVIFMKKRGWTWGGDWTPDTGRIDYQHFEKVPEELMKYL